MIIGCTEFLCPQEGHIKRLLSSDWLPVKQALTPWDNCAGNIKRLLSSDWFPVKQALTRGIIVRVTSSGCCFVIGYPEDKP